MITEHIDQYGQLMELQKKTVTSSDWQGDVFGWAKDKDVKGLMKLASGQEMDMLQKLSVRATHRIYLKIGDVTDSDKGKRLVYASKRYYITYIDTKMPIYDDTVNHLRIFVEERENE